MTISRSANALDINDSYGSVPITGSGLGSQVPFGCFWRVPYLHSNGATAYNDGGRFGAVMRYKASNTSTTSLPITATMDARRWSKTDDPDIDSTYSSTWRHLSYEAQDGTLQPTGGKISGGPDMPIPVDVTATIKGGLIFATFISIRGWGFSEQNTKGAALVSSLEKTGRHVDNTFPVDADERTVFDANMPCSAYLMKTLVSRNANNFAYRTLTRFSFPVVGFGSVI